MKILMRRLSRAGFKSKFTRSAILPEWWGEECVQDPELLPDIEFRVARFLGLPIADVKNSQAKLICPKYPNAQLRRVHKIDQDRLYAAIHAALKIASAVVRSLREPAPAPNPPPADGLKWRLEMGAKQAVITLDAILDDLWNRGIPVVPIDILPAPSFQGLACIVEDRPVILLGHKHDVPSKTAFFLAHETGHIAAGDCARNQPVLDEDEDIPDQGDMEKLAEHFAFNVLGGGQQFQLAEDSEFMDIAKQADNLERSIGVDAGFIISDWARRTNDHAKASMAINALYKGTGARKKLRQHFDLHVDLDAAAECDRSLLRCVYGDPVRDAIPG